MNEKEINKIIDRFKVNQDRINKMGKHTWKLIELAENVELEVELEYVNDIFRAMVVFMYASMEDALRSILKILLIEYAPEAIKKIPLAGDKPEKKFTLEQLLQHKGKSVEFLIQESIETHLNTVSFSSVTNITGWLERIKVYISEREPFKPDLEEMIERRHKIVHNFDLENSDDNITQSHIDLSQIGAWSNAVLCFFKILVLEVTNPNDPDKRKKYNEIVKEYLDEKNKIKKLMESKRRKGNGT